MEMLDIVSFENMQSFFAGTIGGMSGLIVSYPFDTIKVRLQTQTRYKGTLNCLTRIIKEEKFRGLYKGLASPLFGVCIVNSVAFGAYDNVLKILNPHVDKFPQMKDVFLAGIAAGVANSFVSSPIELIKIQLQNQEKAILKGPVHCAREIYKKSGIRGCFRGFFPTVLRELNYGVYFCTYELCCQYLASFEHEDFMSHIETKQTTIASHHLGGLQLVLAGGIAGSVCWGCTYPMDVVKSRIQAQPLNKPQIYNGVISTIKIIYQKEGLSAFFKGFSATMLRAFPANAATLLAYTNVMKIIGNL